MSTQPSSFPVDFSALSLEELVEKIHQEKPHKSRLKKLVDKVVRDLPTPEKRRIRAELSQRLGFKNWKGLCDNWSA